MIDQGYITRSNGALHTQILFRGGQPTLNGKPFNPAAMRPAVPAPPGGAPPQGPSAAPRSPVPPGPRIAPGRGGAVRQATADATAKRLSLPPQI